MRSVFWQHAGRVQKGSCLFVLAVSFALVQTKRIESIYIGDTGPNHILSVPQYRNPALYYIDI